MQDMLYGLANGANDYINEFDDDLAGIDLGNRQFVLRELNNYYIHTI